MPADAVLSLIGFTIINYSPTLLALTLFVSVLIVMTRVYRDSEMVVLVCERPAAFRVDQPRVALSVPVVAVVAALSCYLSPWAQGKAAEYRKSLEARDDVSKVAPGTFRRSVESVAGVFFVESDRRGRRARFATSCVASSLEGGQSVIVASRGTVERMPNGEPLRRC